LSGESSVFGICFISAKSSISILNQSGGDVEKRDSLISDNGLRIDPLLFPLSNFRFPVS
jgi:hypothetical protein